MVGRAAARSCGCVRTSSTAAVWYGRAASSEVLEPRGHKSGADAGGGASLDLALVGQHGGQANPCRRRPARRRRSSSPIRDIGAKPVRQELVGDSEVRLGPALVAEDRVYPALWEATNAFVAAIAAFLAVSPRRPRGVLGVPELDHLCDGAQTARQSRKRRQTRSARRPAAPARRPPCRRSRGPGNRHTASFRRNAKLEFGTVPTARRAGSRARSRSAHRRGGRSPRREDATRP